jgi:hypothetical protein
MWFSELRRAQFWVSVPPPFTPILSAPLPFTMVLTDNFPCMILHRRNLACIGCGCPRPSDRAPSPHHQPPSSGMQSNRLPSSPRFVSNLNTLNPGPFTQSPMSPMHSSPMHSPTYPNYAQSSPFPQGPSPSVSQPLSMAKSPSPVHHLLTPSGRAFAVGGKVQNISTDPLSPCVMYWPDNEPFPEQGQIRPSSIMGVPVRCIHPCLPTFDTDATAS